MIESRSNHHRLAPKHTGAIRKLGFQFECNGELIDGNFDGCWRFQMVPSVEIRNIGTLENPLWQLSDKQRPKFSFVRRDIEEIFFLVETELLDTTK